MDYEPRFSYTPNPTPQPAAKPQTIHTHRSPSLLNFWTGVIVGYWLTTKYSISISRKVKPNA